MEQQIKPIAKHNNYANKDHDILRLSGDNGWANYKYAAPFEQCVQFTNGTCQHIVIVDSKASIPEGSIVSGFTSVGEKPFKQIHFETAALALDALRTITGKLNEPLKLWVEDGFICSQHE